MSIPFRKYNKFIIAIISIILAIAIIALFTNIRIRNFSKTAGDSETKIEPITSLQAPDKISDSSRSGFDNALSYANYILANRKTNSISCSETTEVSEKDGWNQYHNYQFNYILIYPAYLLELKEFNDCAYIEFLPVNVNSASNYDPIYEYYVRLLAIKTDSRLQAKEWAAQKIDFNVTASSYSRIINEIDIENAETIEIGPIPGIVDENLIVISTDDALFEVAMYPAPTQPGQDTLSTDAAWSSSQQTFAANFYQMLNSFRRQ